ncbi:unnamed protein product [Caenorhabditis angaria]|uniref:Uncharacterized protein n=1 Tax=Caenorhabditis angaria TaxID=860376 RepID=A0A9P1J646_9PELO|nr:unnamed protein product [Caenorhabditis angaria]
MVHHMTKKALTRLQRRQNAERMQRGGEIGRVRRAGQFLYTPPRNAGGATSTLGNRHFRRYTSGEEEPMDVGRSPVAGPVAEPNSPIQPPVPQDAVVDGVGVVQPNGNGVVGGENVGVGGVAVPDRQDVVQPVNQGRVDDGGQVDGQGVVAPVGPAVGGGDASSSSGDETAEEEAIAEAIAREARRQRRRRRRGQPRRRRGNFDFERPALLMGDPHEGEVVIDLFLPPVEDETQRESDSDAA